MAIFGLKEYVYREVKKSLTNNVIKPGERIWENKVAEELGISRTPVREAINQLVAEGFVENRPYRGVFAAEVSKEDLEQMLDLRIVLETFSVQECCKNITDEDLVSLKILYGDYKEKLSNGDYVKASQLDSEIHKFIARASNNKRLSTYIDDIQDMFAYSRPYKVEWTETNIKRALQDHKDLIEAIWNKDAEEATRLIQKDIEAMRDLLKGRK